MKSIAHLTSVHPRYDTRIFFKECQSLAQAGYKVSLIVADGKGTDIKGNIDIFDVGFCQGRINRITSIPRIIFERALALDADIYHLHDPELIPVGLKMKRLGKKIIFDSHEDVPKQMLYKHYWNKPARWCISQVLFIYERWACKQFDAIIAATPFIRDKFQTINHRSIDINNYPIWGELASVASNCTAKKKQVCYIGAISKMRGIKEIVQAMEFVENGVRLQLAGEFSGTDVKDEVKKNQGWQSVDEVGIINREGVRDILSDSVAGLVTFYPVANHIDAQPNKMFEYMSAGIPVIGSNFPLWREIIEGNNCGICVDPFDPHDIARAINRLIANPELAATMGANGKKAIENVYNWQNEEQKLMALYQEIL